MAGGGKAVAVSYTAAGTVDPRFFDGISNLTGNVFTHLFSGRELDLVGVSNSSCTARRPRVGMRGIENDFFHRKVGNFFFQNIFDLLEDFRMDRYHVN